MVAFNNIAALSAQANVSKASNSSSASIGRLSSGQRIQKASDDVSGLAVGTALKSLVTTLRAALNNAAQGSSLLQVADGGLSQIGEILQRQKAIAVQASSGQLTNANRALLNQEFVALKEEIDRIATSTNFNGVKLLSGGLGSSTSLANTDALAATILVAGATTPSGQTAAQGAFAVSSQAVQAFNIETGAELEGFAAAGEVRFVDNINTQLTNAQFLNVNSSIVGKFSSFKLSNVVYGAGALGSAKLTATINGVELTGTITGGQTSVTVSNGNTFLRLGIAAASSAFDTAGSTELAQAQLAQDFRNTVIQRTSTVSGVDFNGTRLQGAVGTAAVGVIGLRLSSTDAVISNFRYIGNGGAADTNILGVTVNGKEFIARNVEDALSTANARIVFVSDDNQVLALNLDGLTDAFTATLNIRQQTAQRDLFINALNTGISRVGSGLSFAIGSAATDSLRVSLASSNTNSLYAGQSLDVTTADNAQVASNALDGAIIKSVQYRSTVGALQSRFNFASSATQVALENQDSARSLFLDTDVSGESSSYATAQVQLQAGIAVLAQANQLPQSLLKLLNG